MNQSTESIQRREIAELREENDLLKGALKRCECEVDRERRDKEHLLTVCEERRLAEERLRKALKDAHLADSFFDMEVIIIEANEANGDE